jgi:hypothetical protein
MVDVAAEATLLDVAEEATSLIDLLTAAAVLLTPTQSRGSGVDAAAALFLDASAWSLGSGEGGSRAVGNRLGKEWAGPNAIFSLSASCWAAGPNVSRLILTVLLNHTSSSLVVVKGTVK